MACLLVLSLGVTAKKGENRGIEVNYGEWTTCEPDFLTKFWKEMFKGGGPGQPGNTLMAVGDGFIFKKAVLDSVALSSDPAWVYETIYEHGELILNSSGPWLNRGKLKDKDVTVTNYTFVDGTGFLKFQLEFCGEFDNTTGLYYKVVAWWEGIPEARGKRKGDSLIPVFQRGHDFGATILISDEPIDCEVEVTVCDDMTIE